MYMKYSWHKYINSLHFITSVNLNIVLVHVVSCFIFFFMEIYEYLKSKCIPTLPAMAIPDPNKAPPERVVMNPFSRRPRTKTDLAPRYWRLVNGSIDITANTNIPAKTFSSTSYHPFTSITLFYIYIQGNVYNAFHSSANVN